MKKIIIYLTLIFMVFTRDVYSAEIDILREIKTLREDMNRRFEQVDKRFEQIDKRFEQIDKRFEQVDKRFEQLMWFIGLGIPLTMAIVGYVLQRLNKHDDRFYNLSRNIIEAEDLISAINRAKPDTRKRLKEALKG